MNTATRHSPRRAQQGVVLFIALIVLVAMSLAGVALIRSVDTGSVIAGNLAFRQASMHIADNGVEAARTWLVTQTGTTLDNDNPGVTGGGGYYATWGTATHDMTKSTDFDWAMAINVTTPAPPAGYTVSYAIHRLCKAPGQATNTVCVRLAGTTTGTGSGTKGAAAFGQTPITVPLSATFRVTVRVVGPRNATSYIQAVIF